MLNNQMIEEIIEDILFFTTKEEYINDLERARDIYELGLDTMGTLNMVPWLIHDFKITNKNTFIMEYAEKVQCDKDLVKKLENNLFSVFEVLKDSRNVYVKDIFTKNDYAIAEAEKLVEGTLISGRIYTVDGKHYLIPEGDVMPAEYKNNLIKAVFEKYNEFTSHKGAVSIDGFVKENSIVIKKFLEIFRNVETTENIIEEDLLVYQTNYAVKDTGEVIELIKSWDNTDVEMHDGSFLVVQLYQNEKKEVLIAEIVVNMKKLELECRDQESRQVSKKFLEDKLNGYIVYVNDEILDIEDILNN
jgi:hypothetical protein